jgi:eukaryotic-like serine/threonine-protein kinase
VRVSYQPPPDPYQSAAPRPAAPAGQYSPDGRWYWNGQQWIPVSIPGPQWARPYGPPEGRAAAAVALVALATAAAILFFWGEGIDLVAALATPPGSGLETAGAIVLLTGEVIFLIGLVGAAIAVPMWMHRVFRNLPALGEQGMRWSPAWAAGAWFIPILNFFVPYQVMRVLWSSFGDGRPTPQYWWGAWIGAYVLQIVSNELSRFSRPAGDVTGVLNDIATFIAGFLLITLIRRITRRQRDRHDQLQGR